MNYLSSYDYYRTALPAWGSSQFQFRAPPAPQFQPRPAWSGFDYYRAHAPNPDHNLYYTVMNRTRDFGGEGGVGMHEARIWQRRVYSGLVNLSQLLPADIGVAAAYEAYRYWKHHNRILFEPLAGEIEREKEGLVGLAIAEASALWQLSGRPTDAYGLRDCLESAAITASRIAYTVMEERARGYEAAADYGAVPRTRSRRYSTAGASPMVFRSEPSPYSNPIGIPGRAGSTGSGGYAPDGSPYTTSAMPIPGAGGSPYAAAGGSPYGMSAMPGTGSSPYGAGIAGSVPGAGMTSMPVSGGPYGAGVGSAGALYPGATSPMSAGIGMAGSTTAMPYPAGTGATFPGGYQRGVAGSQQPVYAANPPSPYGGGGVGLPTMQNQPVGYTSTQPGYGAGVQYTQPQNASGYQQSAYADAGMGGMGQMGRTSGATIIANGRAVPAPPGSTIVIDTKGSGRSRRVSVSGSEPRRHHHHRGSSVDPLKREQVRVTYAR